MNPKRELLLQTIHEKIDYSREMEESEIRNLIAESLTEYGRDAFISLKEKEKLGKELFHSFPTRRSSDLYITGASGRYGNYGNHDQWS